MWQCSIRSCLDLGSKWWTQVSTPFDNHWPETLTSSVILGTVTIAFLVTLCASVIIHGMKRAKTLHCLYEWNSWSIIHLLLHYHSTNLVEFVRHHCSASLNTPQFVIKWCSAHFSPWICLTHCETVLTSTQASPYTFLKHQWMQVSFSSAATKNSVTDYCCNNISISAILESNVVLQSADQQSCE